MLGVEAYGDDTGNLMPDFNSIYTVNMVDENESYQSYLSANPNEKSMLMLGDSFSESMTLPLAVSVTNLDVSRTRDYTLTGKKHYDYMVYELVERNFPYIAGPY